MLLVFPLTAAKIVGTDIFHAAALLWVAGFSHLVHGNVDVGAMGWLLLGSIPGVLLASQFTVRVPEGALRVGLGAVLTASGVRLLELPGYELIVPAVLAAGGVLAVLRRCGGSRPAAPGRLRRTTRERSARALRFHRPPARSARSANVVCSRISIVASRTSPQVSRSESATNFGQPSGWLRVA